MSKPGEHDTPRVGEETRERSAEQRNITAPTPKDVRAEAEDADDGNEAPPAADVQAP